MAAEYDSTEARDLLGRAAGAHACHTGERQSAAMACLAAFEKVVNEIDPSHEAIYVRRHSPQVLEFGSVNTGAWISFAARAEGFATTNDEGKKDFVKVTYNASSCLLEGKDEDAFLARGPGQPKRRRSALAVLAEVAAQAITAVAQEEA